MIPNFIFADEMMGYDFGWRHPLKPERLRRTIELLKAEHAIDPVRPEPADEADLYRVHSREYVDAIRRGTPDAEFGIGTLDNPVFEGMHEKSLWYVGGAVEAAKRVRDGASLAINISGGLHHAMRDQAGGFCIYNDPAIMISILRERFDSVAYIDIDVHHGDGVEAIFSDDASVMTISIHESGKTLFPGTGFVEDVGLAGTSVNIPLNAKTTGDVWLNTFEQVAPEAIKRFNPGAIVLQMGTDPHFLDPLGHLLVSAREWVDAVRVVRSFDLPIAACGGGGYNLTTVPRMWAAACFTLADMEVPSAIPAELRDMMEVESYWDEETPPPNALSQSAAQAAIDFHLARFRTEPQFPRHA